MAMPSINVIKKNQLICKYINQFVITLATTTRYEPRFTTLLWKTVGFRVREKMYDETVALAWY